MLFNKKLVFIFLIAGGLLIGALFYFHRQKPQEIQAQDLKPSQLDFRKGNRPFEGSDLKESRVASLDGVASNAKGSSGFKVSIDENATKYSEIEKNLNDSEKKKFKAILEIFRTKNDNDPRLDHDFKNMSDNLKKSLHDLYDVLPAEKRNEKGTLVLLLAKDIKSKEDVESLKKVFEEKPCLSFENCDSRSGEDPHHSGADEVGLNYQQMVLLYQLDKKLNSHPEFLRDPDFRDAVRAELKAAESFPVPMVQKKASEIRRKYSI